MDETTKLTSNQLVSGQKIWIEATINEATVKSGQSLIGVCIKGNGQTIHISVPFTSIKNTIA